MLYAVLLLLGLTAHAQTQDLSAPMKAVLERRHLDAPAVKQLGFVLEGAFAHRLGPDGKPTGPALTPEQFDAWLAALSSGDAPLPHPEPSIRRVPALAAELAGQIDLAPASLGLLYDGRSGSSDSTAVPQPAVAPLPSEPAFDPSWAPIEKDFLSAKTRNAAVKALKARFQKDETTPTGLSADAPEALRLLTREIQAGRGNDAAAIELKRELTYAANLHDQQKFEFASTITSPVTVFVALSRSRSTHSLDSRLYFGRMIRLLDAQGQTLSGFLVSQDPSGQRSADFLLRAHSYDALVPHLSRRPAEAEAIAPLLFARSSDVKSHADALEGLLLQLGAAAKSSPAAARLVKGLIDYAATAPADQAARIALYLKLNEEILPRSVRASLSSLDQYLPPDVLDDAGLAPTEARSNWPTDQWTFTLHFASTGAYSGWVSRFTARGWTASGSSLVRDFGTLHVVLLPKLYQGDEEDFLRGSEASRFLKSVTADLRDPSIQGVVLRTHAQFRISNLFSKSVNTGKLLLDGACRSAWDLRELRKRCPSCQFIVNTGTGRGKLNNDAVIAVVEGLANDLDWSEIGTAFARTSPSTSARIQGPWTPPFAEALKVLEAREKADLKSNRSKS